MIDKNIKEAIKKVGNINGLSDSEIKALTEQVQITVDEWLDTRVG